jgi:hypothetical protein
MSYGIIIPGAIAAKNVDAFVKTAKFAAADVENGSVLKLGAFSTTRGESEVYLDATPATASLSTDIFYLVNEPVLVAVGGKYRGLTDDPREFINTAGNKFTVFKPQVGDEVVLSADALAGTKSSNTYVVPANDAAKLTWAASTSGVSLALEYKGDFSISVGSERVTGYKFLVVVA